MLTNPQMTRRLVVPTLWPFINSAPVHFLQWRPSLLAGHREWLGRSTSARVSLRSRSTSCCGSSPTTRRLSRRLVVSASLFLNRSRPHPQLLMVKLLRQCLVPLPTLRRWSRRRRMRANDAALRGAPRHHAALRAAMPPHPQSPPPAAPAVCSCDYVGGYICWWYAGRARGRDGDGAGNGGDGVRGGDGRVLSEEAQFAMCVCGLVYLWSRLHLVEFSIKSSVLSYVLYPTHSIEHRTHEATQANRDDSQSTKLTLSVL